MHSVLDSEPPLASPGSGQHRRRTRGPRPRPPGCLGNRGPNTTTPPGGRPSSAGGKQSAEGKAEGSEALQSIRKKKRVNRHSPL
ncbi:unnamed protein product [Arctogadus glacialis]